MDNPRILSGVTRDTVRYFAVFGNPVLHSRSPQIYNSLFIRDEIDAYYTRINAGTGKAVCEIIRGLGLSGANVTTPFKEDVVPFLDRLSPDARMISAVNTIMNRNGELSGYNTDAGGITGALAEAGIDPAGKRCMVMGAGGAGRAAAMGLVRKGADVLMANRSSGKASEYAMKTGCRYAELNEAVKMLKDYDILVMALPPGIYPFRPEQLPPGLVIAEANYRLSGGYSGDHKFPHRTIKGDRWLLHQAVEAYRLFTGKDADTEAMERGMKAGFEKKPEIRIIRDGFQGISVDRDVDMLVDGRGTDDEFINKVINEEEDKAFGHKG